MVEQSNIDLDKFPFFSSKVMPMTANPSKPASGSFSFANKKILWTLPLLVIFAGGWLLFAKEPIPPVEADILVYKSPQCGCCNGWVDHLRENGLSVAVENVDDMGAVKQRLGLPEKLASCHTGLMSGYVVEGHVPVSDLKRLLKEKPDVKGIAVPGMPIGSPGMEMPDTPPDRYEVVTYTEDGRVRVFSRH